MTMKTETISLNFFSNADALCSLRKAAEYLRNHPGTTLVIPAGRYLLHDEKAAALQKAVMTGEYGRAPQKRMFSPEMSYQVGVDLTGCSDVTISGYGAQFVFDGYLEPFCLSGCRNVTLKGFSIDYLRKPWSKGVVVGSGDQILDVAFPGLSMISVKMPALRAILRRNEEISRIWMCMSEEVVLEKIDAETIRFHGISGGTKGDEFYLWHTFHFRPGILIYESATTLLEDITIFSQPGMGIVGHRSQDIVIRNLSVVPGAEDGVSTNTDATHFASCKGLLRVENSTFRGQGDDALNVHTYYHTIQKAEGVTCQTKNRVHSGTHSQKPDHPDAGDVLELTDPETLASIDHFVVHRSTMLDGRTCSLLLDHELPEASVGMLFADITQLPRLEFMNCHAADHIARSLLIRTRNVRIEGCTFERCSGTAVHIAAESGWFEGAGTENVLIRGNKILGAGKNRIGLYGEAGGIAITTDAIRHDAIVHRNIVIEENVIDCPETLHAIYADSTEHLVIRNNSLSCSAEPLQIGFCRGTEITKNRHLHH